MAGSELSQGGGGGRKYAGFVENAVKNRSSFVQLFFMTGILLLSMRSLGQKYRIQDLQEDTSALRRENASLSLRIASIRSALLREASLDSSGALSSQLQSLFRQNH